jgi:hypothetical protein
MDPAVVGGAGEAAGAAAVFLVFFFLIVVVVPDAEPDDPLSLVSVGAGAGAAAAAAVDGAEGVKEAMGLLEAFEADVGGGTGEIAGSVGTNAPVDVTPKFPGVSGVKVAVGPWWGKFPGPADGIGGTRAAPCTPETGGYGPGAKPPEGPGGEGAGGMGVMGVKVAMALP